jgi:hypothetical protein
VPLRAQSGGPRDSCRTPNNSACLGPRRRTIRARRWVLWILWLLGWIQRILNEFAYAWLQWSRARVRLRVVTDCTHAQGSLGPTQLSPGTTELRREPQGAAPGHLAHTARFKATPHLIGGAPAYSWGSDGPFGGEDDWLGLQTSRDPFRFNPANSGRRVSARDYKVVSGGSRP